MSLAFDKTKLLKQGHLRLPVSHLESNEAAFSNKWYGRIPSQDFNVNRKKLYLRPRYTAHKPANIDMMHFSLEGFAPVTFISIEKTFLAALFSAYSEPLPADDLAADDAALLLELSFAPVLTAFEQTAGVSFKVVAVNAEKLNARRFTVYATAYFENEDRPYQIGLGFGGNACTYWDSQIDAYGRNSQVSPLASLPLIAARLCLAIVDIKLSHLSNLNPGDVVMLDSPSFLFNHLELCVGPRCAWRAQRRDSHIELIGEPRHPAIFSSLEGADRTTMTSEHDHAFHIDDIPVPVSFEIGRKDISVAELKTFHEGTIVEFPGCDFVTVSIVANGRRIGTGTLVEVGNTAGVRIERIFTGD